MPTVRILWRALLWLGIITVLTVAAAYSMGNEGSLANFVLGAAVLLLTGATLDLTYLRGPKLVATRPDELALTDVVYFADLKQMAADFLVQVHTAIANVGGRSAVLTTIKLVELTNGNGQRVELPNTPSEIGGTDYRTWTQWSELQESFERTITPLPFVLAPDNVMVIRFREGRGIEWGPKWTLEAVRALRDALTGDIKVVLSLEFIVERVNPVREFLGLIHAHAVQRFLEQAVTRAFLDGGQGFVDRLVLPPHLWVRHVFLLKAENAAGRVHQPFL